MQFNKCRHIPYFNIKMWGPLFPFPLTVFWIIHRFVALFSIRGRTRSVSSPAPRNLAYHQILICLRSTHPTLPPQHFGNTYGSYNGSVTLPPFWIFLLSAVAHKSLLSLRLFLLWQHKHLYIGRVSLDFPMCVFVSSKQRKLLPLCHFNNFFV